MMKIAGNTKVRLYELQGFYHGSMPDGAFPLLLKEINFISKRALEWQ
jgi:hypothetical protein